LPEKRGSWPVRHVCSGARSPAGGRTGDNRCPLETTRRGTSSACARRTHSPRRRLISACTVGDTSFTQSRDPCTSIVTQLSTRKRRGVARMVSVSRSGKPAQAGRTGTGAETNGRKRGSPRVTAFRGNPRRSCVMRQKRKVVMAIVPARKRESRRGVRTSCSVAEVGRQHPDLE